MALYKNVLNKYITHYKRNQNACNNYRWPALNYKILDNINTPIIKSENQKASTRHNLRSFSNHYDYLNST